MSEMRCTCDPAPMACGGEGPSETCEIHGRDYHEWVERGNVLNARLEAVKEVIAKVRRTPVANDPYRIALDIADDLEAAVYLEPGTWPPDHGKVIDDLRDALTGAAPAIAARIISPDCDDLDHVACGSSLCGCVCHATTQPRVECCASGRCEVCTPGWKW